MAVQKLWLFKSNLGAAYEDKMLALSQGATLKTIRAPRQSYTNENVRLSVVLGSQTQP